MLSASEYRSTTLDPRGKNLRQTTCERLIITIRLRAQDFYEVLVDEGEAREKICIKYCTKTLKNIKKKIR